MNGKASRALLALLLFVSVAASAAAQNAPRDCLFFTDVSGGGYESARNAQLLGQTRTTPQFLRRVSDSLSCIRPDSSGGYQLAPAPAWLRSVYNSAFPLDRNNGALWAGRGTSASFTGGLLFGWGAITASLAPTAAVQQNMSFPMNRVELPGYSPFVYPNQPEVIDFPQRFGSGSYRFFDFGQSFVRFDTPVLAAGISNENLWLGPALRNPLLLSNTAAGFPHAFVESQTLTTDIGRVSAELVWGRLSESKYFDDDDTNDARLLSGIVLGVEPEWTPGLVLGFARLYTSSLQERSPWSAIGRAYGISGSGTRSIEDNSIFALYGRYVLPSVGAQVYVEWGHEVGYRGIGDLVREPDQSQAYVLGFDKLTPVGANLIRVYGELTHLDAPLPLRSGRGVLSFYTHGAIRQGHTQRGQLLGSWIGPGSNAQIIGVDFLRGAVTTGAFVERTRFDADAYYNLWSYYYGHNGHDAELSFGLRNTTRIGALLVNIEASYGDRYNRMFRLEDGSQPIQFTNESNANIEIGLNWFPGARR